MQVIFAHGYVCVSFHCCGTVLSITPCKSPQILKVTGAEGSTLFLLIKIECPVLKLSKNKLLTQKCFAVFYSPLYFQDREGALGKH